MKAATFSLESFDKFEGEAVIAMGKNKKERKKPYEKNKQNKKAKKDNKSDESDMSTDNEGNMESHKVQKNNSKSENLNEVSDKNVSEMEFLSAGENTESVNASGCDNSIIANNKPGNASTVSLGAIPKVSRIAPNYNKNIDAYPSNFKAVPFVLIDASKADSFKNYQLRDGIYFSNGIKNCGVKDIKVIEMVGRMLVKISFNTIKAANDCVNNEKLKSMGLVTFIPRSAIETYGVVRHVPPDLSDEEILASIRSEIPVSSIFRFSRQDPDKKGERIPTFTIKLGFLGDVIPKHVYICYVRANVEHYIPQLRQCAKCGRIGHAMATCRSDARCIKCGSSQVCEGACLNVKCILCGGNDHNSTNRKNCPIWDRELKIHEIKNIQKISRKQAIEIVDPTYNNRFAILNRDESEFPPLVNEDNTRNPVTDVNRILTQKKYSHMARQRFVKKAIRQYENKNISNHERTNQVQNVNVQPKQRIIPVYERKEYKYTTEIERLMADLLKMSHNLCYQFNDSSLHNTFDSIRKQYESIKLKYDVNMIRAAVPRSESFSDEDSTI